MRKLVIVAALAATLSACAAQPRGPKIRGPIPFAKNPSVVLALDIAQNRAAQDKDAYSALYDTAAPNAVTFVPRPVQAKDWLKAQQPLTNTSWKPHAVYLSCDGKTGVTTGEIRWGEVDGYYTTVWQYFERRGGKGEWRWLVSHGDALSEARKAPEFLQTKSASCKGKAPASIQVGEAGVQMKQGLSFDQSLSHTWRYRPDGSRSLVVKLWNGTGFDTVLTDKVVARK